MVNINGSQETKENDSEGGKKETKEEQVEGMYFVIMRNIVSVEMKISS